MSTPTIAEVCNELLAPLIEIVGLYYSNGNFQDQVFMAVRATGKTVDELTVRELRELIELESEKYNAKF